MMPRSVARSPEERLEAGDAVLGACSDLVELQALAILGKLTAEQTQCLEASLTAAERMTQKSKISRVLMVHAFSAGETDRWEQLMKRHLEEIEQSDPDLCYKYSLHLSKKTTTGAAYGVIRWSNVALENRTVWTGSTYTQRVFSLYKIRAVAAQRIWQDLENTARGGRRVRSSGRRPTAKPTRRARRPEAGAAAHPLRHVPDGPHGRRRATASAPPWSAR
jgi:hypothetical protein